MNEKTLLLSSAILFGLVSGVPNSVLAQTAPEAKPAADTGAAATDGEGADESWLDQQIPGQISGGVAFTTDYIFRGVSQTDNNPAVQGSLEYAYETEFFGITPYAGIWGSNVDFNDGDNATVELDWSFGLRGTVPIAEQEISWDIGGIYYSYPGAGRIDGEASNYNYWEIASSLGWAPIEPLSFGASYYYSPDFFAGTGHAHYLNGLVTFTPPNPWVNVALFAGLGRQWIEDAKDYTDWTIGATVSIKGVDLTLQYTDTNLTQAELGGNKLSDARVIFTAGVAF
ncbi:MAG: TorF family putative porin [Rhodospirillales bacterium]|nr:TorF family putative porin [Rhodospirillales bacterium]